MPRFSEVIGFCLKQRQCDTPQANFASGRWGEDKIYSLQRCIFNLYFVAVDNGPPQDPSDRGETSTGNQSYENLPGEWF